ncbi:unnamed protein product [Rhizophagus irregularis]|uniref:Uncharacterized protein n=1 Tax=Rhizophagus irregularis TaxID=588596 RepID=A0A915ZTB6_9GLOM|nr:unnamed protein product [Rhizophagus irregularis]CAB5208381.1 unnamed protein product [Rhizophagus irregularis]CAB5386330.1 unnamed protein product [Rhizophagus irregularis]
MYKGKKTIKDDISSSEAAKDLKLFKVRIPLGDGNIVLICSKGDINNIRFIICYAAEGSSVRFYAIDGSKEAVKQPNQLTAFTNELNASNLVNRITILRRVVNIARIVLTINDEISNTIYPSRSDRNWDTYYVFMLIRLKRKS